MQVLGTRQFGGGLAQPAAGLVLGGIDAHEIYAGQVDVVAVGIHRPVDVERDEVGGVVGVVVHIAPVEGIEHVVGAHARLVLAVVGQAGAREGDAVTEPAGVVVLLVVDILDDIAVAAVVVAPPDIGGVGDGGEFLRGRGHMVGVRAIVGDLVVVTGVGVAVGTTCQFVPLVVGQPVLVAVERDHDDAGFAAATLALLGVRVGIGIEGVAEYLKVALPVDIHHTVVEAESDVSAEAAEGNHPVVLARDALLCLLRHVGCGVALFVLGQLVNELPGRGAVLIDGGDVAAVCHLLLPYDDAYLLGDGVVLVDDVEAERVVARVRLTEDKVALGADEGVGAVRGRHGPLVAVAGELGVEYQGAHTLDGIDLVNAEIYHRDFGLARNQ